MGRHAAIVTLKINRDIIGVPCLHTHVRLTQSTLIAVVSFAPCCVCVCVCVCVTIARVFRAGDTGITFSEGQRNRLESQDGSHPRNFAADRVGVLGRRAHRFVRTTDPTALRYAATVSLF